MFNADLISPEDVYKLALRDPNVLDFDISGFKFIAIKPMEFKLVATQINKVRKLEFLFALQLSLNRTKIPLELMSKISEYLDEEDYRPLKILNKL
jgi:hypothetical protein